MSRETEEAVVLRTWDYSETSQTVALLTRGRGLVRGLAKGAKRERGAFGGGFEVATRGEVSAILKAGSELATLTEWDLGEVFWGVRRTLVGHRAGLYMVDVARHAVTVEDPHPGLFDGLVSGLRALDGGGVGAASARFLWCVLEEIGYRPAVWEGERREAVGFDAGGGRFTQDPGEDPSAGVWRVRWATVEALRSVAAGEAVDEAGGWRVGRLLSVYLREVLGRDMPTRAGLFGDTGVSASGRTVSGGRIGYGPERRAGE